MIVHLPGALLGNYGRPTNQQTHMRETSLPIRLVLLTNILLLNDFFKGAAEFNFKANFLKLYKKMEPLLSQKILIYYKKAPGSNTSSLMMSSPRQHISSRRNHIYINHCLSRLLFLYTYVYLSFLSPFHQFNVFKYSV